LFEIRKDDWIISDTHFFHNNIIKYCGRPQNHDDLMIYNWNRLVQPSNRIIHGGDLLWSAKDKFLEILPMLRGEKFILVGGNHDKGKRKFIESCGFTFLEEKDLTYNKDGIRILFTHRPIIDNRKIFRGNNVYNVHGHIHEKSMESSKYINICVEHYNYRPIQFSEILKRIRRSKNGSRRC